MISIAAITGSVLVCAKPHSKMKSGLRAWSVSSRSSRAQSVSSILLTYLSDQDVEPTRSARSQQSFRRGRRFPGGFPQRAADRAPQGSAVPPY